MAISINCTDSPNPSLGRSENLLNQQILDIVTRVLLFGHLSDFKRCQLIFVFCFYSQFPKLVIWSKSYTFLLMTTTIHFANDYFVKLVFSSRKGPQQGKVGSAITVAI